MFDLVAFTTWLATNASTTLAVQFVQPHSSSFCIPLLACCL